MIQSLYRLPTISGCTLYVADTSSDVVSASCAPAHAPSTSGAGAGGSWSVVELMRCAALRCPISLASRAP
jgi:hypothetical protein